MNLIHEELYPWQTPVLTEKTAYELLKQDPLRQNQTYVAVAWSSLIDKLDFGSEADKAKASKDLAKLQKIKVNNGFTVCQHDRFHLILPTLEKMGIKTLFASHMVASSGHTTREFYYDAQGNPSQLNNIVVDTIFLAPVFVGSATKHKDVLYSFIGSYGKKHISKIREKIFQDTHSAQSIIIERKGWQFDADVYGDQVTNNPTSGVQKYVNREKALFYEQALTRSRFSLCPSGTGPTSIRFLESLGSGAIPVILADTMMLPKIKQINWNDCTVKIPEKDYYQLRHILSAITPEQEEIMRQKGLEAYKLCTGKNFIKNIREYYD
jgi:hypothetical protein